MRYKKDFQLKNSSWLISYSVKLLFLRTTESEFCYFLLTLRQNVKYAEIALFSGNQIANILHGSDKH